MWRASKQWCKALQARDVPAALARFAECGGALRPADIYGGPRGAAAQLQRLERWLEVCLSATLASDRRRGLMLRRVQVVPVGSLQTSGPHA